jgi:hypothetical protein
MDASALVDPVEPILRDRLTRSGIPLWRHGIRSTWYKKPIRRWPKMSPDSRALTALTLPRCLPWARVKSEAKAGGRKLWLQLQPPLRASGAERVGTQNWLAGRAEPDGGCLSIGTYRGCGEGKLARTGMGGGRWLRGSGWRAWPRLAGSGRRGSWRLWTWEVRRWLIIGR